MCHPQRITAFTAPYGSAIAAHMQLVQPDLTPLDLLVVEDNLADATLTERALRATHLPMQITRLNRGDTLMEHLKTKTPDLILLDLGLPGINGFEILEQLAAMPASIRAIPVVLLTGFEDFSYLKETYPLSVVDYLTKPCTTGELTTILQKHVKL